VQVITIKNGRSTVLYHGYANTHTNAHIIYSNNIQATFAFLCYNLKHSVSLHVWSMYQNWTSPIPLTHELWRVEHRRVNRRNPKQGRWTVIDPIASVGFMKIVSPWWRHVAYGDFFKTLGRFARSLSIPPFGNKPGNIQYHSNALHAIVIFCLKRCGADCTVIIFQRG
jgi:hypothetical protein